MNEKSKTNITLRMIEENKKPDSLELFHVQSLKEGRDEWFAKRTYTVGSGLNLYYQKILESLGKNKSLIAANIRFLCAPMDQIIDCSASDPKDKAFDEMYAHRNLYHEKLIETTLCLSQYLKWINEEILENIRSAEFQHLPSRKRGLWLCNYDSLPVWVSMKNQQYRVKILKVEAKGKFHRSDGGWISANTYSIDEFQNRARNYWSGELVNHRNQRFFLKVN